MPKTKAPATVFSEDELMLVQQCAYRVWDECAYDLLMSVAEEKGKSINAVTIPRAQVIEIALDAGRCEERIKWSKSPVVTPEFLARWEAASYEEHIAAVRPAFSYSHYGM